MQNLWKTYDDITSILRKRKIRGKWCHSGNPQSEANTLTTQILKYSNTLVKYFELKITDNQSDDFLRMFSKMTYHFPKQILGSRISLTYKRLIKILQRT